MNWAEKTIGSIVSQIPAAATVFKSFGIDYCCGGQRVLSKAIAELGINQTVIDGLLNTEHERVHQHKQASDFQSMKQEELSLYIEATHHAYMREALPRIGDLFGVVLKAHGRTHTELFELHRIFSRLRGELEQHLIKEETLLFPDIAGELTQDMINTVHEIKAEHDAAGAALRELRRVSSDYTAPVDGCATYETLFAELEQLEDDLHQHVHLENNILLVDIP